MFMADKNNCPHKHTTKEVMSGMKTGDRVCRDCGATFSDLDELVEAQKAYDQKVVDNKPKE
jgi:hypothetical protein